MTQDVSSVPAGEDPGADAFIVPFLDQFEIRVLAVLAEKEALTPDNYPLSLNTLVNGCNQLCRAAIR